MKWIGQHIYDLAARFRGDVTIEGDLTVNGTYTQIDTDVTTTEQWLVTNDGTGPAAIINQKGSQDIFDVQDDGTSVFYIEDGGNVGIGTTSPGYKLHVAGGGLQTTTATGNKIAYYNGDSINTYSSSGYSINNFTGNLTIKNSADDGDVIFQSDNGSGGVETYFFLDGSLANGTYTYTRWADNDVVAFGNSQDFLIYHNATNTLLYNSVGDIQITNTADDKDISFRCDDGSGGTTEYFRLDGSDGNIKFYKDISNQANANLVMGGGQIKFSDAGRFYAGDSNDLQLYHDGSNSYIKNETGNLILQNNADDADIAFYSDDQSGSVAEYFRLDGSNGLNRFFRDVRFNDSVVLKVGSGDDMQLLHDASNSHIVNYTGDFKITQNANDKDIIFNCDDGSGGNTAYLTLDGSVGYIYVYKDLKIQDSVYASFGTSNDFLIGHDGTNTRLYNYTGNMQFINYADDSDIIFQSDDGAGGVATYFSLDGSSATHDGSATTALITRFPDNSKIYLGTGDDGRLYHNGTDTYLQNTTGDLIIQNFADDKDIILKSDDGSGGTTPYLTLDGSRADGTYTYTTLPDSGVMAFGASVDMQLYHNATDSIIRNNTGDLKIINYADDKDIIFQSDDGSGGTETYFFLDGSTGVTTFPDDKRLTFGTDRDLFLYHTGGTMVMKNYVGDMTFTNNANDKDIIFQSDDGSGGVAEYFRLNGGLASPYTVFPDDSRLAIGGGLDLRFHHDGGSSYIGNYTGNLLIRNFQDDGDIIFQSDDGSGGTTAYLTLDGGEGRVVHSVWSRYIDNARILIGTGGDLALYHDGSNSFITDTGTGDLYIAGDNHVFIRDASNGQVWFQGTSGGVNLRYQDNVKITTTSGGVNVTGDVIASGNIIDGATQIKVLPHQFMSNEDGGVNKSSQFRDDTIIGVRSTADDSELYAFVEIPYGKTATSVTVYGNDTSLVVNVYESDINAGALTDKTPGGGCVVGTACDITDVAYSATNYLVIKVTTVSYTNDIVYGAVVTIT